MSKIETPISEPTIYDFNPHNLPAEMLRAIGLVTASASQTEHIVQDLIGGLLKIDELETLALTVHMSAPLKDHIARAVAELNAPNAVEIDKLDDLLDAVNAAYAKRNVIVHNSLAIHPETGVVFSYRESARGSLSVSLQPVTVEQFEQDAALIYEAGMNLMRFMIEAKISPRIRTRARNRPFNRGQKARMKRRNLGIGDKS